MYSPWFIVPLIVGVCLLKGFSDAAGCNESQKNVFFLIDSSEDVRSKYFYNEKLFLSYMANHLMDSNGTNKIGIATFTDTAHIQIDLNQYHTKTDLHDAIQYMWYSMGVADVGVALTTIIELAFDEAIKARPNAKNALIVLTHVPIHDNEKIHSIVQQLTRKNIALFIIGVGPYAEGFEFIKLTSLERFLYINSVDELTNVQDDLISRLCTGVGRGFLGEWNEWSACGVTCGLGFRERYRNCTKYYVDDADCKEPLVERLRCKDVDCKTPVDGEWSFWDNWSGCSKTCGNGTQIRRRQCDNPPPSYGGNNCPGSTLQSRECSIWSCPDCNRTCPPGGHLSKPKCDVCMCTSTNLFGTVTDWTKRPIENAKIFLQSKPSEHAAVTDDRGRYQIKNICMMGETIEVKKDGYLRASVQPFNVNASHWTASFSIKHIIPPIFITHPQSKIRLAGQSATFCCNATGDPQPNSYTWLKNNVVLENVGEDGTLEFASLLMSDAGIYQCSVETEAGITLSSTAELRVEADGVQDTCSGPKSRLEDLPPTCNVVNDDGTESTTIDVGTCGSDNCISLDLRDNSTCYEWWPRHCCEVDEYSKIDVICDGFSYKMNKVRSCRCQLCVLTNTISGVIKGRENGVDIPMQLGSLYIDGEMAAMTNMQGYFNVQVSKGKSRLVINIIDEVYNKFVTSTKIFNMDEGISSAVNIIVPLRPKPIPINTALGANIPLGGSPDLPPAATLSIPSDSIITSDGQPFIGTAHTEIQFVDPRKMDDIESSQGELVYEAENGERRPLETFGMFGVSLKDNNGRPLRINSPMNISLDTSVFNISKNKNGDPNLALWYFDVNKGVWVKTGDMKFSSINQGTRRRLLDSMVVGSFIPQDIPLISLNEGTTVTTQVKYISGYTNCDHSVPIYSYREITVRGPDKLKEGACILSVTVYTDLNLRKPMPGINVVAATQDRYSSRFKGIDRKTSDKNGHVCLSIFCDANIYLYAEDKFNGQRLFAHHQHDLPPGYFFQNTKNGTEVFFESINREFVNAPGAESRYSPVLYFNDEDTDKCKHDHEKNYKFQFAPATKEPNFDALAVPITENDKRLSWYPTSADKPGRRACFMKILVKTPVFDSRIIATSYLNRTSNPFNQYGTHNVGPMFDPFSDDRVTKAACVEFRCPGHIRDDEKSVYDVPTLVNVSLATDRTCKFRIKVKKLNVMPMAGGKQFLFYAEPGSNYGPKFGVYINNGDTEKVRHYCMSGSDTRNVGNIMKPLLNPAVEFDCTGV